MVKQRSDGTFELGIDARTRDILVALLTDLADQIDVAPDDPSLRRLSPPAYLDDAERDAAYQLLAGEELRSSHRAAIEAVLATLEQPTLTSDELWAWLQALNVVRLVMGTRLDITEDDHRDARSRAQTDEEQALWAVYDYTTYLQYEVITALGG